MALARPRAPWDRTPVDRRDYFEILGPGLVVVLPPRRPQEGGSAEWTPPTGGAWIHVGTDGRLRAFTGKAEVGQGTRTALALIVAEEARVPLDRVEVAMADTDVCPWDMGTFGSRSMPDAASALRTTAAALREALVGIAAERWGRPGSALEAREGAVRDAAGTLSLPYGSLVADRDRVVIAPPTEALTPPARWHTAGRPTIDAGATEVVTGRRRYGSDLKLPGMRYGAVLRPPRYGARLLSVETDAAERRPGVTVVRDREFLGVVASSMSAARAALATVQARWEEPSQPGEREIERYLREHPATEDAWDTGEDVEGEVDVALASSEVRVSESYRTAFIAHVPLEPHVAIAAWDADRLTVWVGTQTPFRARDALAAGLGLPVESVRVIVPPTGAGFGGKHGGEIATQAARLARVAGAPVRLAYSREEEFRFGYLRPMSLLDVRAGAGRDGRLTAWAFHNVNGGAAALLAPYRIPARRVTNTLSKSPLPQGSYRSLAAAANNFARESAIDELARRAAIDPLELRRVNLEDDRLRAVVDRAAERAGWSRWKPRSGAGHGLALGREKGGRVATVAEVSVAPDRRLTVVRLTTAFEAGAIVHPDNLRSQVEGAVLMGLGGALFEAIRFRDGVIANPRLSEYRVPRFTDLPALDVDLIDRPDLPSAGAGETPIIAVAPAVANAIADATGIRLRALPLVPDGFLPEPRSGPGPPGGGPPTA